MSTTLKKHRSSAAGAILLALLTAGTVLYSALSSRTPAEDRSPPALPPEDPSAGISRQTLALPDELPEPDTSEPSVPSSDASEPIPSGAEEPGVPEPAVPQDLGALLAELAASLPADPDCPLGDLSPAVSSLDPAAAEAVLRENPKTAAEFRAAFRQA
ncbi:MAG: hypothetical protein J6Q17_03045, partial [Clostridia bacterium]|nr:hypothetical protein [Clostridia bacterium]